MQEIIYNLKNKIKFLRHNFGRIILILFLTLIFLISIYFYNNSFKESDLKISFFDVGQGDSVMIETPSHKKIIIDAGPSDKVLGLVDDEMNLFDREIDLAIMSHPDQDHVAGFLSLFKKYNFQKIIWNGDDDKKTEVWQEIKKDLTLPLSPALAKDSVGKTKEGEIQNPDLPQTLPRRGEIQNTKSVIANCGDEINFNDGVMMYILHSGDSRASHIVKDGETQNADSNSKSIIALLIYKNYSFLFTGDATAEVERKIFFDLEKCFDLDAKEKINFALKNLTVLKASHHGSDTGSSEIFLKKIKPEYSIVSVGEKNKYNLPNENAMSRIKKYSKYILRTDESGNIKFVISDNGFEVKKEK